MQKFVLNTCIGGVIDNTFGKFFEIFTEPLKYFLIICGVIIAIVIIYYVINAIKGQPSIPQQGYQYSPQYQQPQMGYQQPQMGYQPMGQTGGLKLVKK